MEFFSHTLSPEVANYRARDLIVNEIKRRNDLGYPTATRGQLLNAAMAYMHAIESVTNNVLDRTRVSIFDACLACYYPADWHGFHDQGSDVANLVVAAAFLQQEIARRLSLGEASFRTEPAKVTPPVPVKGSSADVLDFVVTVTSDKSWTP